MLNTHFTATNHLHHPHRHARPPKLVLQQGQCLPLALMSHIPMAPIHGCHSYEPWGPQTTELPPALWPEYGGDRGHPDGASISSCPSACAWTAVSSSCLCILLLALATVGSWVLALPAVPMVTPSRLDFTASAFSFDTTWLRASATALSHLFWYLMLNVNPASNSIQWCWVASKLGVVKMWASGLLSVFTTNSFQCMYSWSCSAIAHFKTKNSCLVEYAHGWSGTGLHMQQGGITHQAASAITLPPILTC